MYHGHILKYNAADLVATGAPAPAINLTNAAYFNEIFDLAFDSSNFVHLPPIQSADLSASLCRRLN